MNHIQRIFGKPRVLLPVIHVHSGDHAEHNARVAMENGADGVFLINQGPGSTPAVVMRAAEDIIKLHPTWWVGVNLLGENDLETLSGFRRLLCGSSIRGLWSDDAGVSPKTSWSEAQARQADVRGARGSWEGLYLAGAAFKYQAAVPREQWGYVAVMAAASGADVVVTSGEATGSAAPSEKLAVMREALSDYALGLASGVSEENIGEYSMVNAFVVASSLLRLGMGDNFDPVRMRRLADLI